MRDSWLQLVDSVLRPARPERERCLREREPHLAARRIVAEERARAMRSCEADIEGLRAAVFAAKSGAVPRRMTELEREWGRLSRADADAGMMDLWARIAPPAWLDRKRWRDSEPSARVDAALALAADVAGVEAAESAALALRDALAASGTTIGARLRWRAFEQDVDVTSALLGRPAVTSSVVERATGLEEAVHEALLARFPERPLLARSVAHAAFVDGATRGTNVLTALRTLWSSGYVLSAIGEDGMILELPPL